MRYGKYITEQEASCKCGCGLSALSPQIVEAFTKIREGIGISLRINSATRCPAYNEKTHGKPQSAHLVSVDGYSHALDIATPTTHIKYLVIKHALDAGIKRIGVYPHFVHIDTSPHLPQEVCW